MTSCSDGTLILLAPPEDQQEAAAPLRAADPGLAIVPVADRGALERAVRAHPRARLLSVCSPVIVPARVLAVLPGPAYNLHPGPPAYPGLFPAVFALYEGATTFGATLHEMAAAVDAGAIVATSEIDIPPDMDRLGLETLSRRLVTHLLRQCAPALARVDAPLPSLGVPWRKPTRRQADFEALCRLPEDVDAAEFQRRLRAVGEGPRHALRLPRFGRWFRLDSTQADTPVVRGGRVAR
ncbi:formyltransferase family protein [Roseospira visakhapatnamensis]|uniref:Methionyl-tRNA formyltransferase n=1 Tax=Roseospira visakhapatnamensis TaxID=390880 RepID=A0A7W6RCL5_9PROT|nr:formyltransferase family protein [Roseospira visakhapatnamensis]MBB4265887.1 methionyl-tRNA formyltransferase [Roseospira visakhapatnamensis]